MTPAAMVAAKASAYRPSPSRARATVGMAVPTAMYSTANRAMSAVAPTETERTAGSHGRVGSASDGAGATCAPDLRRATSAPAGRGQEDGQGSRARRGRAQHGGAEPDRPATGRDERLGLRGADPALGADDQHDVTGLWDVQAGQRLGRLLVEDEGQVGPGDAVDDGLPVGGRRERRHGRPSGLLGRGEQRLLPPAPRALLPVA